jgi:regulator of replication initiation timing
MSNKLNLLLDKIEDLIEKVETLQESNKTLKSENRQLKIELSKLSKANKNLKLGSSDKTDVLKTRLTGILNRLDQLEELAS